MQNLNVLIIEDEIIIYMHITKTLKQLGFKNIQVAKDAQTAIEIAKKSKIDLVFSDIKIKGEIDGIETSQILQTLYGVPIIFITAYKDEETLLRASNVDFIGYLLKPYRQDELEALIKIAIIKYNLSLSQNSTITINKYTYNKITKELQYENEIINLTKKEHLFIALFTTNLNAIIPYNIIDKTVWYKDFVSENTRRTFIYRIKNKLKGLDFRIEKNIGIGLFENNQNKSIEE